MTKERFFIYSTVFLIMGLSNSVIPVLPEIAAASSVKPDTIAYTLLFSGYFIGALLTLIPFGFLADSYDNYKIILLAVALTSLSGIMLYSTDKTSILILARLIEGIACGAFFPPAYAMLAEFHEKKRYLGEFNFLLNAGLATGALVAGFLASRSTKGALIVFTSLSLMLLSSGIFKLLNHRNAEIANRNIRKKTIWEADKKTAIHFHRDFKKISSIALNPGYLKTWIIAFFIFGITGVILAHYPEYSQNILSKPELGIIIAILYVSSMTTNLIAGRSNISFRKMIASGIVLAASGVFMTIKFPLLGFALLGIGSGLGMVGLPVAVSLMNTKKGLNMGIFTTYTYMGLAFLPMITGFLIKYGYQTMFATTAFVMALTFFLKDDYWHND